MYLVICLDEENGMAFNGRRQTRDKKQRLHLVRKLSGKPLFMLPYSGKLWNKDEDISEEVYRVTEELPDMKEEGYLLVEREDVSALSEEAEGLLIYRWNRLYLKDVTFPEELLEGFRRIDSESFSGSSHDKITCEEYVRK